MERTGFAPADGRVHDLPIVGSHTTRTGRATAKLGDRRVTLTWTPPVHTEHFSDYLIQRSTAGGPWRTIAVRNSPVTHYVVGG